jgi:uncharacterized protein YdaU (DUF1376 family)
MHYYQHHIGDYRKDTGHLSILEHGVYRQLLDSYYLNEEPLTLDRANLMRTHSIRTADEERALENVLNDFFVRTENGYIHTRCDAEIEAFHKKSAKASQSAKARWANKDKPKSKRNANAKRTQSDGNANQEPITNNHIYTLDGVSDSVLNDFIKLRKGLKAPVTDTAIKGLKREGEKAGMTLEQVMSLCCQNGWRGFKAEWVKNNPPKSNQFAGAI